MSTATKNEKKAGRVEAITITAPRIRVIPIEIRGTAPYVQNKFSAKTKAQIKATQEAGSQAKTKKKRDPKNFRENFEAALHRSRAGWPGIPAPAFRNAMIDACRMVGYKMTQAKMSIFIEADDYDADDGTPLVKINGKPQYHEAAVRLENGSIDLRARPMFLEGWTAVVKIKFDEDQFSPADVCNLLMRAGAQVGIGEGRPFSKNSCGMGWGTFELDN